MNRRISCNIMLDTMTNYGLRESWLEKFWEIRLCDIGCCLYQLVPVD